MFCIQLNIVTVTEIVYVWWILSSPLITGDSYYLT